MKSRYAIEVSKYGKKDGIAAICVFLGYVILSNGFALVLGMIPLTGTVRSLVTVAWLALLAVGVLIIVKASKQKLSSIGFQKENIGKAIGLALLFCLLPIVFVAVIPGILHGFVDRVDFFPLVFTLLTTFIYAAHEDIIFVGFIQTRLYGFFKSNFIAILVGALLFSLMHLPPWIAMGRLDISQPLEILLQIIRWAFIHVVFVAIFKKYFSIVPIFILHTINNLSHEFSRSDMNLANIMIILYLLAACFLYWHTYKADKKLSLSE